MPRNPEVDRLKGASDQAFHAKQASYDRMKPLGQRRHELKDQLDASWDRVVSARGEMNSTYERQQSAWEAYRSERDDLSAQIDDVARNADRAHENMKDAFQRASDAYECGDKASAPFYSQEGQDYRYERDDYNAEKRRLIDIAKSMTPPQSDFRHYKERYDNLMESHKALQAEYREVKTRHEAARDEFDRAKERFEQAREAYDKAIEVERAKWRDEKCQECGDTIRVNVEWSHPPKYCKACKEKFARQREETKKQRETQDYLIANLRARSGHTPVSTGKGGKVENSTMYIRGPKAGRPIHVTQVYDDGWHISWNAMPDGTVADVHWTHHGTNERPGTTEPSDATMHGKQRR